MVTMSRDEFWMYIEQCRQHSSTMQAFNRVLEEMLDHWELPKLAAFHKVMWDDLGVYNNKELWNIVEPLTGIAGDDSWERYGGGLSAQGREFYEAVMQDPKVAATRIPPKDDIFEGESVIFLAQVVCVKKTEKWNLHDLFGYNLDGQREQYVDWPVTW